MGSQIFFKVGRGGGYLKEVTVFLDDRSMGWNLRKIYTRLCVVLCLVPCHFVGRFRILNEVATFIYRTEKILVKKKTLRN